jgi:hypothetical protein
MCIRVLVRNYRNDILATHFVRADDLSIFLERQKEFYGKKLEYQAIHFDMLIEN